MPKFDPWAKAVERNEAERKEREANAEWQEFLAAKRASEIRSDIAAGIRDADGNFIYSGDEPEDDEDETEGDDRDLDRD